MKEIETKIVGIDEEAVRRSFKKHGARFLGRSLQRRYVFDLPKVKGADEYLRVRASRGGATLTYKRRKGKGLRNTEEIEVQVSDFDKCALMLLRIWKKDMTYYQENLAEEWAYKGAEIKIAKWPRIPAFLEIESKSAGGVRNAIKELRIEGKLLGNVGINKVYTYYGEPWNGNTDMAFRKASKSP